MRATILPYAFILTKAHRAAVSMMAKGCIVASILPLRCFLFLLPKYTIFYLHYLVTSLKYSFLNTPDLQYVMLLTSGG